MTRNLDVELNKTDWELMVLHYLGLDHIGHIEGPYSNRIKSKLLEMDSKFEQICLKLAKNVSVFFFERSETKL